MERRRSDARGHGRGDPRRWLRRARPPPPASPNGRYPTRIPSSMPGSTLAAPGSDEIVAVRKEVSNGLGRHPGVLHGRYSGDRPTDHVDR
ncbi:MAG: hypothetical protein ACLQGP_15660 [Isosphaeraceae bacterium]